MSLCLSEEVRFDGGGLEVRSICAMSCRVSSAVSLGKWAIDCSTWEMIFSIGIDFGVMAKLKPLDKS